MTNKIKVLIVDDHPLILEGLKNLLTNDENINLIHLCKDAIETMEAIKKEVPEVALLDINLPDINGITLCEKIKHEFPSIQVIALTTFSQRSYINKMVEAGASGYLLKNAEKSEIISTIKEVNNGGICIRLRPETKRQYSESPNDINLTPREKEVLQYIAEGLTNNEIAKKLFVSVLTVNSHRKNLLRKFDVKNTALLIKKAASSGMV
ncbi:response regulator [Membranihabitans marinus]|uniref:response regulator n=1 Tax=Membranihabitans marinus TaxID=1227546 RepID=UPI001F1BD702|nr:response regulator transcription factor [Membranihabitans marinus]